MIKLWTDAEMIEAGHHRLFLHTEACQKELAELRAVADAVYTAIDREMSDYDDYEAPPQWMTDAYLKLFDLLDKSSAPEADDPSGGDLPL